MSYSLTAMIRNKLQSKAYAKDYSSVRAGGSASQIRMLHLCLQIETIPDNRKLSY